LLRATLPGNPQWRGMNPIHCTRGRCIEAIWLMTDQSVPLMMAVHLFTLGAITRA